MGINVSTLYDYQNKFNEISEAIKKGKAPVDIEVENALLKKALGYDYEETITEIYQEGEHGEQKKHIKKVKKHMPPDVAAQIFWLKNRRPDKWRDKPIEHGGQDTEDLNPLVELLT